MMLVQKDRLILTDEKHKELLSNYLDSFCLCELYEDDGCSQLLIAIGMLLESKNNDSTNKTIIVFDESKLTNENFFKALLLVEKYKLNNLLIVIKGESLNKDFHHKFVQMNFKTISYDINNIESLMMAITFGKSLCLPTVILPL